MNYFLLTFGTGDLYNSEAPYSFELSLSNIEVFLCCDTL